MATIPVVQPYRYVRDRAASAERRRPRSSVIVSTVCTATLRWRSPTGDEDADEESFEDDVARAQLGGRAIDPSPNRCAVRKLSPRPAQLVASSTSCDYRLARSFETEGSSRSEGSFPIAQTSRREDDHHYTIMNLPSAGFSNVRTPTQKNHRQPSGAWELNDPEAILVWVKKGACVRSSRRIRSNAALVSHARDARIMTRAWTVVSWSSSAKPSAFQQDIVLACKA